MKKIFTLLAIATSFAVMAPASSQARDRGHDHDHDRYSTSRSFSHSCRVCGRPVFRERVYVGRDRHGHPMFDWRVASHDHSRGRGPSFGFPGLMGRR